MIQARPRGLLWLASSALGVACSSSSGSPVAAPESGLVRSQPDGDWRTYNRDLAGTRSSPLAQIDAANVHRLTQVWTYAVPPSVRPNMYQFTPIAVNGVLYVPAGKDVAAVDGETGREIWRHQTDGFVAHRGVAYWAGDANRPPRIVFTSLLRKSFTGRLHAVDARTGKPVSEFGNGGTVEVGVPYFSPPSIAGDIALIGANVNEVPLGPPGDTRAYDVRTGRKLWEFHSVPHPGELGNDTWGDGSWKDRSGSNVWAFSIGVDAERGLAYLPIAGPSANYWGGDRPGNNLFSDSIVAVDVKTGAYRWHFQAVHHDLWDFDMPSAPSLVRAGPDALPALAFIGKPGYMFVLDRRTGKPVFGVEERAVPRGDVPGEWYSPTQPFPIKPPPLARVRFDERDLVTAGDTTPEHAAACRAELEAQGVFGGESPFAPWPFHAEGAPPRSIVQFPGGTGGAAWGGLAVDAALGYAFVQTKNSAHIGWIEVRKPGADYGFDSVGSTQPYDRGSVRGPGWSTRFVAPVAGAARDPSGARPTDQAAIRATAADILPCQRPPWGLLSAVDLARGQIVWQVTLGLAEALPPDKQRVGLTLNAGPTVTAGGVLFIGATADARFRAFESRTGKELWSARLAQPANANPMTYSGHSGKQYVAIVAGDTLTAFALP